MQKDFELTPMPDGPTELTAIYVVVQRSALSANLAMMTRAAGGGTTASLTTSRESVHRW